MAQAHLVTDRLEALKIPTVAVIHGFCLGGGLEIALACQSRIAIDNARFGFPEVLLGLHPGLGGTARFTELVNPVQAMSLMLTGRTIDARRAKALGLVDSVTQERHVRGAVKDVLFGRLKRAKPGLLTRAANLGPVRGLLAKRMRSEAAKGATGAKASLKASAQLMGLLQHSAADWVAWRPASLAIDETKVEGLIAARNAARKGRDFKEADRLRDEIAAMGIELEDRKDGTTAWKVKR